MSWPRWCAVPARERPSPRSRRLRRGRGGRGLSLIELMVGIAIGLALVVVVLRGYAATSRAANLNSLVSEYQTNGRHALEVLRREIRHAALSPLLWDGSQLTLSSAVANRNFGCGLGVNTSLMDAGLAARDDANPYVSTCLAPGADREYLRGDVLSLRRLSNRPVTAFLANAPYVRVSYGAGRMFLGGETPDALPAPAYDHALETGIYFVNTFTERADEAPRVPALYRLRLSDGANPTMVPELVASNIEHLQVQFTVDQGNGTLKVVDPGGVTDWRNVVSARLWVLVRASAPEPGYQSGSYRLGNTVYTPVDGFRRAVLASTVHLRNP